MRRLRVEQRIEHAGQLGLAGPLMGEGQDLHGGAAGETGGPAGEHGREGAGIGRPGK
jgi:hypothetical protein